MMVESLPYWLVNIPKDEWPAECPDFLTNVNTKDRGILATPDAQFHRQNWPEVQHFIKTNRIDLFQRVPSEMRRYLAYNAKLRKEHGSVMNFVVKERLHWSDLTPKNPKAFSDPDDIKILYNDWPYGVDKKIVHLVIWTKFNLEDDPATDDLTDVARREIDDYVNKTFCTRLAPENVIWFKNWRSLKSVHAVEHFHVMLCDPDPRFVEEITNGDVALSAKV
ncbi:MAG: hypothetical protein FRX48_00200 [Lasallia pustulata]|uniref:N-acetylglucosamine-induced protein 1 n=2 Tax=Lasallia pustulata TaxID=136370 RepID=A0A5M8Q2Q1_9LECA|nr:MAG: hypothetical protein FRX48_00200 [Lasallia pustulata]